VKRLLSLAASALMLTMGISSISSQDSQFAADTIPVESLGFGMELSPDNQTVAVYENFILMREDKPVPELMPIKLIDLNTHETIGSLSGFTDWVTDLSFSPDGQRLISSHRNGDVVVWDVANLSLIKTIRTYSIGNPAAQFINEGKTAAFRWNDFVIGVLDVETEAITHLFGRHLDSFYDFSENYSNFPGRGDLSFVAFAASQDGKWLARSSQNDEVTLTDIESGEEWTLREKSEQPGRFAIRSLFFSADSSQLVYFDQGTNQTHWWNVQTREEVRVVDFGGSAFALAPDATTIAWADRETSAVYMADTATSGEPIQVLDLPETLDVAAGITSLAFTSDGTKLVIGGLHAGDEQNNIYVVDLSGQ
jgi:WD40 repeat protein